MAQLFTGRSFIDESSHHANGPSLDQILLKNSDLRGGTPIASIHLCVADRGGADKRHIISYSGPGQPMTHTADPARAFSAIFSGVTFDGTAPTPTPGGMPDAVAAAKRKADQRILEINTSERKTIQRFLGEAERRHELHVESACPSSRSASRAWAAAVAGPAGAAVRARGHLRVQRQHATTRPRSRAGRRSQADIIVSAFTCDRTRVADYHFSFSGGHH